MKFLKKYDGFLPFLIIGLTILSVLYITIWWGLVQPIFTIADAIDNHTITATLVAKEAVKFLLKEFLGVVVFYLGFFVFLNKL